MTTPLPALKIRRALISLSDKQGIETFARGLRDFDVEIISTGGTLAALEAADIPARSVSNVTGFPEILDGRVKTLHPHIHAGLLAALDNAGHVDQLREHGIDPIDLVVVNLYPFEQTIARENARLEEAVDNLDIGGPAMIRAAAKNYRYTAVVVNPYRYGILLEELRELNGCISAQTLFELATEAFAHTARYDTLIASYFRGLSRAQDFPEVMTFSYRKEQPLRYGENPHQSAALYGSFTEHFKKLHGKELSYNNILDIDAAASLCAEFDEPTAAIVKHNNPCGVGSDSTPLEAYQKALGTDPTSAFGGIVCFNRPIDLATAETLNELFLEVIIAPEIDAKALTILSKKKDRRILRQTVNLRKLREYSIRSVAGGLLVQEPDQHRLYPDQLRTVTERAPSDDERRALLFAWRVAKHVKSNAIVYAREDRTMGIGAGQMSRVDSSRVAAQKAVAAGLDLTGCALASDAFFPFADGLLEAVKVGATAVIQPGGSVRDQEVIQAANDHNLAMVFTGIRHFRH